MVNMKLGIMGAIATVVIVMIELILFPIVLLFLDFLNDSACKVKNATGTCVEQGWVSASDQTLLLNIPTLLIVTIIFTVLGGMVTSILLAVKG